MPSTTRRQHRTMEAAVHNDKFRRKLGIPRDVAEEFVNADKRENKWQKKQDPHAKAMTQVTAALLAFYCHRV